MLIWEFNLTKDTGMEIAEVNRNFEHFLDEETDKLNNDSDMKA